MFRIGIDCEETARFRKSKKQFYRRTFTPSEIKYCETKAVPYVHYAGRFAAKEAVCKALGCPKNLCLTDIEISSRGGRPSVKIRNKKINSGIDWIQLSISHTKQVGVAVAILYESEKGELCGLKPAASCILMTCLISFIPELKLGASASEGVNGMEKNEKSGFQRVLGSIRNEPGLDFSVAYKRLAAVEPHMAAGKKAVKIAVLSSCTIKNVMECR